MCEFYYGSLCSHVCLRFLHRDRYVSPTKYESWGEDDTQFSSLGLAVTTLAVTSRVPLSILSQESMHTLTTGTVIPVAGSQCQP
jgi:hypothetical protein